MYFLVSLSAQAATEIYYIHNDHLGTPQALTNQNQNIVWTADQTPFGELQNVTGTVEQPIRFPGQYADPETGYSYNYFRDYDPSLGRYLQSDPIGLNGGMNTYAYVEGNPIKNIDPKGLATCTYSITARRIVCTSNTANDPSFVGPPEIRTIDPDKVHSGRNEHRNNPDSADVKDNGPIWPGNFEMSPNNNRPDGWWALREPGWNKFDSLLYKAGLKRGGANLHQGSWSKGCLTVDPSASDQYNDLTNLLKKESDNNWLTVTR